MDSVASARNEGAPAASLDARLETYLRARFGSDRPAVAVTALAGDASTRKYYRIQQARESWVAALYPEGFIPEQSTYLTLRSLLAEWGLPVPAVVDCDGARGVVLLEDLGDCTLQQRVAVATRAEREDLYRHAIADLVRMQRAADSGTRRAACFDLAFDVEKLSWELDFFVEHFMQGWRGRRLSEEERSALAQGFDGLSREIAAWPRVLCHRDYHSRNLMWRAGRLYWVDFQDARMGPVTYDVASLLRDSYVDLDEEMEGKLIEEFRQAVAPTESPGSFERRFELTCLQRNLKALGTFGYQAVVRGKREYLEFVPRTLAHVRRNLWRHGTLGNAAPVLARHIEECRA